MSRHKLKTTTRRRLSHGKVHSWSGGRNKVQQRPPIWEAVTDMNNAFVKWLALVARESGMPIYEAALRWIVYHSALGEDDGVILGASKISQLKSNLGSIEKGPLDAGLVVTFDEA
ncbi:Oxidoreductase sirO [Lachnellula suecica]|uniref:Oxidoreductase sirO n=1 Tax=Lachnellula suecica TaxID=602035 RepID=A0A8T9BS92_9HELO|nr:Oxidoreductase sirO [Lachnellula suecica]